MNHLNVPKVRRRMVNERASVSRTIKRRLRHTYRLSACVMACASLLWTSASHADSWLDNFSYSGFGTLSAVKTNNRDIEFIQNNRLPDGAAKNWRFDNDSVLGLQGQYAFSGRTKAVVQLLSRRNHRNNYEPQLDWAYVSHKLNPNYTIRAGRFISPVFFASDYRNVNYSNAWVRPPIDMYSQATINNIDGADIVYRNFYEDFTYQLQFYAGQYTLPFPNGGDIKFHHMAGLTGSVEYESWTLRLGYMDAKHSNRDRNGVVQPTGVRMIVGQDGVGLTLSPADATCAFAQPGTTCAQLIPNFNSIMDFVRRDKKPFDLANLAVVYDNGLLFNQFEIMHRQTDSILSNGMAAYNIMGYRFGKIMPYVSYSYSKTLNETRYFDVPAWYKTGLDEAVIDAGFKTIDRYYITNISNRQNTLSAGVRYDFYKGMALKFQIDKVRPLEHMGMDNDGNGFIRRDGLPISALGRSIFVSTVSIDFIF